MARTKQNDAREARAAAEATSQPRRSVFKPFCHRPEVMNDETCSGDRNPEIQNQTDKIDAENGSSSKRRPSSYRVTEDNVGVENLLVLESKKIICWASMNDFSSSLFDAYEIKSLSNHVASSFTVPPLANARSRATGKWCKNAELFYNGILCFPPAARKARRRRRR